MTALSYTDAVSEGYGTDGGPEYDTGMDYLVVYVDEPPRGISLQVGTRIELRSLPGVWTIDVITNKRLMLRGPAGASAQVLTEDIRKELKTVLR